MRSREKAKTKVYCDYSQKNKSNEKLIDDIFDHVETLQAENEKLKEQLLSALVSVDEYRDRWSELKQQLKQQGEVVAFKSSEYGTASLFISGMVIDIKYMKKDTEHILVIKEKE